MSAFIHAEPCSYLILGNANKYPKVYQEHGEAQGILVDMMRYVGEQIQCDFTFRLSSWKRAYVDMLNGDGLIIGLSKTTERIKTIDYSEVMFVDDVRVVTLRKSNYNFTGLNDLKGLKVIFSRGASYGDDFDRAMESGLFIPYPDDGNIVSRLLMVLYGRVDAALVSPGEKSLKRALKNSVLLKQSHLKLHLHATPLKEDANYLGAIKGAFPRALLEQINMAIRKGHSSSIFTRIEDKYFNQ